MGIFKRVLQQQARAQSYGARYLLATQIPQQLNDIFLDAIARYVLLHNLSRDCDEIQNLLIAAPGWAAISTALIIHCVCANASAIEFPGHATEAHRLLYAAARDIMPLKDLPTESVDPITTWMCYFLKNILIQLPSCYMNIISLFNDGKIKSRETANELMKNILNFNDQGNAIRREVRGAVGSYFVVANFLRDKNGGILVGLPTKDPGLDIAMTAVANTGTISQMYTSVPIASKAEHDREAWSYFHDYVRHIDQNYVVVGQHAKNDPFDEANELCMLRFANGYYGSTTVVRIDSPSLKIIKPIVYDAGPQLFKASTIVVHRVSATGDIISIGTMEEEPNMPESKESVTAQDETTIRGQKPVVGIDPHNKAVAFVRRSLPERARGCAQGDVLWTSAGRVPPSASEKKSYLCCSALTKGVQGLGVSYK
ncbi:hypothetical protein AK812_SmicGene3809 [Symbiodinium microadriaticum]|uniref:Uncharacterized protein n=1 Tax=Symbiodinium microadriaticum TaxID=2951 RepID=A0A1Q9EY47_SYMMI|nr:hypothetical protein AK812_SmicGene3809 [Symbiodinium microadriaticum]